MSLQLSLLELIDAAKLDEILSEFTTVTDVASIIADPNGYPLTRPHNFTRFCEQFCRSTPEGRRKCHQSDRFGGVQSTRSTSPPIYPCLNAGLLDCAAPVIVGGYHMATVLCGQVLGEPLKTDLAAKRARSIGIMNVDGYLEELANVPIMSRSRLLNIANLMSVITKTLSELALGAYQLHKQSQEYLSQVINAVSDCIISTDSEGIISVINEAGAAMFGAKGKDLIGRSLESLFAVRNSETFSSAPFMCDLSQQQRREMIAVRQDSKEFPVQISVSEIDECGKNPDYVAVIRDISEEKRIERMKEDLIGMVMHDIRNPVLSLQKAMQLLADETLGPLSPPQLDMIRLALGTSHQLFSMASNLLDIYRNENGQLLLVKSPIDMVEIIEDAISQLEFFAKDKRIAVSFEKSESCLRLFADQKRLLRVCVNLLDNAVKYSPEQGKIKISCRRISNEDLKNLNIPHYSTMDGAGNVEQEFILVTIADEGLGIPAEYQEKVFDKFFTVEMGEVSERKGSGLGLAFCKQVIEAHKGYIWVKLPLYQDERGEGRGCELAFLLPTGNVGKL